MKTGIPTHRAEAKTFGERWFGWLLGVTALVGALWQAFWPWLNRYLEGPLGILIGTLFLSVLIVVWRDRERGLKKRAARLEQDLIASTLPPPNEQTRTRDRERAI
jgi:hypothetical protein